MQKQASKKLLKIGIIGSILAAICCFTPILVILLAAVGLSPFVAYLDYVLLPSLFLFIGMTFYALLKKSRRPCDEGP